MPKLFRPTDFDFISTNTHENPFLDVDITGSFVHEETGERIVLPGFWKGDNKWCVRFSPTRLGRWNYVIESNDESLNTAGAFIACKNQGETELDKHGFVKLSDKGRYFEYADGTPFYWVGDTNWQAPDIHRLSECNYPGCECGNMFAHIVNKRKEQGFNVFQTYPSAADNDGGGGKIFFWWKEQYTLINPEAFNDNFDVKMNILLENGFTIALGLGVHSNTPNAMGENLSVFAKYMVARYAAYPIVWITGQEVDIPRLLKNEEGHWAWIHAAETIAKYDGYNRPLGTHLYSREFFDERSCSPDYEAAPWHQWWALQAGHRREWENPTVRPKRKYQGYWDNSKKPMLETESFYEDLRTTVGDEAGTLRHSAGYDLSRNSAWMSNLCGCAGFTYGAHGVWGARWSKDPAFGGWCGSYNSEPWFMGIEKPGANELKHLASFLKEIDFTKLTPAFYDTTYGEFSDSERAILATIGTETYVVYLYGAFEISGVLKNLDMDKEYKCYWYDPRTGAYIPLDSVKGVSQYVIPARPDKNDWTLLVTTKDITIPYTEEFYHNVTLTAPVGTPVEFSAFTVSTDNTTEMENIQKGILWRPFAAHASNIIKIDLGQELELASIKLDLEKNLNGKYTYRVDGIKDGIVTVLADKINDPSESSLNIHELKGTFRYLNINFISEPDYIDAETRLVAGVENITIYKK